MMLEVGQVVRVLPPFADSFPGEHAIIEIINNPDGTTVYVVDNGDGDPGNNGYFDARFLEVVA
jgi:hypothetical protein